jgi:hypothetical protein
MARPPRRKPAPSATTTPRRAHAARRELIDPIQATQAQAQDPTFPVATRLGWHGPDFVLPGEVIGPKAPNLRVYLDDGRPERLGRYRTGGTLERFREIARLTVGNSLMEMALSIGFAGPVAPLLVLDQPIVMLVGAYEVGKSTVAKCPGAVWGRHADPNAAAKLGFGVVFDASSNDLENEACQRHRPGTASPPPPFSGTASAGKGGASDPVKSTPSAAPEVLRDTRYRAIAAAARIGTPRGKWPTRERHPTVLSPRAARPAGLCADAGLRVPAAWAPHASDMVMPSSRITLPHFSASARSTAAKASGVSFATSTPIPAILSRTSGSSRARLISALRRATRPRGMSLGPRAPYQTAIS